jgi:membrane fusion protein (multidrug efflux system)
VRVRYVLPILAVLALVAGLIAIKAKQIGMLIKAGQAAQVAGPPPEVVSSAVAKEESWENTLSAVGSIETVKGVTVSAEVPGTIKAIKFDSGATVKVGDVLVELDTSVERAQLQSALARKQLAATNLERNKKLVAAGTLAGASIDADQAALDTATADVAALQAQIARKIIRAPFAGKLGIRPVNLGQFINPGTPIASLEGTESQAVEFTLPQQKIGEVAVGTPVRVTTDGDTPLTIDGAVSAIDPNVDPVTRSLRLRANAVDKDHKLHPGMFVRIAVVLPKKRQIVSVPVTSVIHASYGDSVFIIEDKPGPDGKPAQFARQQFVRTGETRGDFIAIEQGVESGAPIVVAGAFKLRNGARIVVNNDVKTNPALAPKVDNH